MPFIQSELNKPRISIFTKKAKFRGKIIRFLLVIIFLLIICQNCSAQIVYVPGNSQAGVGYTATDSGNYKVTIEGGAWSPWGSDWDALYWDNEENPWLNTINIYVNRPITWSPSPVKPGYYGPSIPDYPLGGGEFPTQEAAQASGIGDFVEVTLNEGEYINLICPDHMDWYGSNRGGMTINITDSNFGYIRGYKLLDTDNDNVGDTGFEGWKIELNTILCPFPNVTYTDSTGYYEFGGLSPGIYDLREEIREGYTNISPIEYTNIVIDQSNPSYQFDFVNELTADIPIFVLFDQLYYDDCTQPLKLTVIDESKNQNPAQQESVEILLQSWYDQNGEEKLAEMQRFTLLEEGLDSPYFSASINFLPPIFTDESIEVSARYPGMLIAQYETGTGDLESTAAYKFCLDVAVIQEGHFTHDPSKFSESAFLPLNISVSRNGEPVPNADIEMITVFGSPTIGRTNNQGYTLVELPLNDEEEFKYVNRPVQFGASAYFTDENSFHLYGESSSTVICSNIKFMDIEKIWTPADVAGYVSLQWIVYKIRTFVSLQTVAQYVSERTADHYQVSGREFIPFFFQGIGLVQFTEYWQNEINWHPSSGDILKLEGYEYTAGDIHPIRKLVLLNWAHTDIYGDWKKRVIYFPEYEHPSASKEFSGKSALIQGDSPIFLYIEAPDGRRGGYDPITREYYSEFPVYMSDIGDEPFIAFIPSPLIGDYLIQVVGTGSGPYQINETILDEQSGVVSQNTIFTGTTNENQIDDYHVVLLGGRIHCYPGWNFVSIPKYLSEGKNSAAIFSAINTSDRPIFTYNAEHAQWIIVEENTLLEPLNAYWIYSTELAEVPLDYSIELATPPVKHLYPGWNAIGLGSRYDDQTEKCLLSLGDTWDLLLEYDNSLQIYFPPQVNGVDTGTMQPGRGYWIHMKESGEIIGLAG